MLTTGKKMISNTIYLFLDWIFLTVFGFLFWFIIGKTLLPDQYGIIATAINFMILLSAISIFGLNYSVSKLIPEYVENKQIKKIRGLIRFSLKVILISNILLALIVLLFSQTISSIIKVPIKAILMTSLGLVIISFANIFGNVLYGFQNMKKYFKTNLLGSMSKVVISALLIFLGFDYLGPLIAFLMSFFIIFLLRLETSFFKSNSIEINKKLVVFNYALPAFISSLCMIVLMNTSYIILSVLKNPEITGIFAIAFLLTSPLYVIPTTLSLALFPITSQLSVNHQVKKQTYLINLVVRYTIFIVLPILAFLVFYSKAVILIFSRPEYLPATKIFPILALAAIFYGLGNIFISSLYAIKKPKINRNISVFSALLFLILSIPLTYSLSALGTSLAYFISVFLFMLLSYVFLKKYIKLTLQLGSFIKVILSTVVFSMFLFISDILPYGFPLKILIVFIGMIFYLITLIPLKFYMREDIKVLEFIGKGTPIFRKQLIALSKFLSKKI